MADARSAVDAAVVALVGAATGGGAAPSGLVGRPTDPPAVVAVSPFTRAGSCRISAARDGEQWRQEVTAYTIPGRENAVLDRLARGLPASYRASARKDKLRADAGDFVSLSGGPASPGEVRITVATGCRAGPGPAPPSSQPDPAARGPVEAALGALDVRPVRWSGFDVPCPDGGALHTATAESEPGTVPGPLPATLMSVGPGAVVAEPDVYAYRAGDVSVVVRLRDGVVSVSATTGCR